jgi:hypothetical protein
LEEPDGPVETPDLPIIDDADDPREVLPFTYDISSEGGNFDVEGLVRRVQRGTIDVPKFQRDYVWSKTQADRFIESLLLGLPVPGIFLFKEPNSEKLLVLDGLQRLRTLEYFYRGLFRDRKFALKEVQKRFVDKTYETLEENDRLRLDNYLLHATIVQQLKPSEDQSGIYFLFERINTGGTSLAPQEIRACLYQGGFKSLLTTLNEDPAWRAIYGRVSNRMKDQELILRFFALYYMRDVYARPMKKFLNEFMGQNRNFDHLDRTHVEQLFLRTISLVHASLGPVAFRPQGGLNAAVFDSVMVGLATRLERNPAPKAAAVSEAYFSLITSKSYGVQTGRATADKESVLGRIESAIKAFAKA